MPRHTKPSVPLYEGGAAVDFSNIQLSEIFHTQKEDYLTTVGNRVLYPRFLNTVDYQKSPPKEPKPTPDVVKYGCDNVKVISDFPKAFGTLDTTFLTTDGGMEDIIKKSSRNVDVLSLPATVFQPPPKIEELKQDIPDDLETLLKESLRAKEADRRALLRSALLSMGLTEAEVRSAEVAERVKRVMDAVDRNQLNQFIARTVGDEAAPAAAATVPTAPVIGPAAIVGPAAPVAAAAVPARGGAGAPLVAEVPAMGKPTERAGRKPEVPFAVGTEERARYDVFLRSTKGSGLSAAERRAEAIRRVLGR